MKKFILILFGLILAIAFTYLYFENRTDPAGNPKKEGLKETIYIESTENLNTFYNKLNKSIEDGDLQGAQNLFTKDATLQYRSDNKKIKECNLEEMKLFFNLYFSDFKEMTFPKIIENEKYLVATSKQVETKMETEHSKILEFSNTSLFFIKEKDGNLVLNNAYHNISGGTINIYTPYEKQKEAFLKKIIDSDKDGLTDYIEQCLDGSGEKKKNCTLTDPLKVDTDNNGVWDGFEIVPQ